MTSQFRTHIRTSLADSNLQSALDANAEKRIKGRLAAMATLADPQSYRRRAHKVRAEVIAHLDVLLNEFIENAKNNGVQVHRATDAEQARKIILEIAHQHNAKLIAKSKTMVSEEIHLNQALEQAGLTVVETDLGEYIVQLRGETPSHIITPSVHLRRQDVGKLFEQKFGLPYTEDIGVMTDTARKALRQVFLEADIGVSGVNFGIAETGTVCLVTNEGNGRMVTTLPRVHIALMGIERLVPTLDDLALILSLLPRSATSQKLSVYTSLLNGPRRLDDPDGPQERHILLVDNGRSAIRGSPLEEILYCIRCGACLNACPVFREIGGHAYVGVDGKGTAYPGPMGSVISPALFGIEEFGQLARASSLCGACREACPVDIDLPKLLLRVRAGMGVNAMPKKNKPNTPRMLATGLGVYTWAAASPRRFALAQKLAGFFSSIASIFSGDKKWLRVPAFSGWGYSKDFPAPVPTPFHARYRHQITSGSELDITQAEAAEVIPATNLAASEKSMHVKERIERFSSELTALGVNFYLCQEGDTIQTIEQILRQHGIDKVLSWDEDCLPDGLVHGLSAMGIHIIHSTAETLTDASTVRAGITGVAAAVAETGSLLITGGAGRPLTTSLLPEIHIAVLCENQIFDRLEQVIQLEVVKQSSSSVFVTGPSRTADIEMTLTIGVHGPGELHVVCIKKDQSGELAGQTEFEIH